MLHAAGRGVVELIIEKPDGASAYVVNEGGGPQPQAHLTLVLEGYSAPVTAGNFASNVLQRLYIGKTLTVDYTGILVGKGTVSGGANSSLLRLLVGTDSCGVSLLLDCTASVHGNFQCCPCEQLISVTFSAALMDSSLSHQVSSCCGLLIM